MDTVCRIEHCRIHWMAILVSRLHQRPLFRMPNLADSALGLTGGWVRLREVADDRTLERAGGVAISILVRVE